MVWSVIRPNFSVEVESSELDCFRYDFLFPRFCTCAPCRWLTKYYSVFSIHRLLTILLPTNGLTHIDSRQTVLRGPYVSSREYWDPSWLVPYPFSPLSAVLYMFRHMFTFAPLMCLFVLHLTNRDGFQRFIIKDINPYRRLEPVRLDLPDRIPSLASDICLTCPARLPCSWNNCQRRRQLVKSAPSLAYVDIRGSTVKMGSHFG